MKFRNLHVPGFLSYEDQDIDMSNLPTRPLSVRTALARVRSPTLSAGRFLARIESVAIRTQSLTPCTTTVSSRWSSLLAMMTSGASLARSVAGRA